MHTETVGKLIARTGDDLGNAPHGSGLNSIRRNGIVGVSKGCDATGRGQTDAQKAANHRGGLRVIEQCYDDATSSTDNGAHLMKRAQQTIESLRSVARKRLLALAKMRVFSDVPVADPVRQRVFELEPYVNTAGGEVPTISFSTVFQGRPCQSGQEYEHCRCPHRPAATGGQVGRQWLKVTMSRARWRQGHDGA